MASGSHARRRVPGTHILPRAAPPPTAPAHGACASPTLRAQATAHARPVPHAPGAQGGLCDGLPPPTGQSDPGLRKLWCLRRDRAFGGQSPPTGPVVVAAPRFSVSCWVEPADVRPSENLTARRLIPIALPPWFCSSRASGWSALVLVNARAACPPLGPLCLSRRQGRVCPKATGKVGSA